MGELKIPNFVNLPAWLGSVSLLDTGLGASLKSCRLLFPLRLVWSGPPCQQDFFAVCGRRGGKHSSPTPVHVYQCPQQDFSIPVTFSTAACLRYDKCRSAPLHKAAGGVTWVM